MTAFRLYQELTGRKERGAMLGQPSDLQTAYVTNKRGITRCLPLERAAEVIKAGGALSDYSAISVLYGFAGLPPEASHAS